METTRAPRTPDHPDTAILWCNIGTPDAPTVPAVRRYLAEFLGDPRIVELPRRHKGQLIEEFLTPERAAGLNLDYLAEMVAEAAGLHKP